MTDHKKHGDDTVREETSAFGERLTGATKDAAGSITGNRQLEREGEIENARGRERQASNDVFDETDGVPGRTLDSGSSIRNYEAGSGTRLGTDRGEREREWDTAGGRGRQTANDAFDAPTGTTSGGGRSRDNLVTGLYSSPEHAGRAYEDLTTRHGYKANDISVLMSDETRQHHFGDAKPGAEFKTGSKAAEGAGIGGAAGLGVGATLGALLAAATSIAIPGVGLIVAGPIAGAIAGAGAGGAAGTLLGALIGAGIPEERAKVYDDGIRSGGIVLGTRARDDAHAAELERDFTSHGGRDILR